MSTSKVTGTIEAISDYKENDYFNVALDNSDVDDNWYIGDGTLRDYGQFDKGDRVRLHVDNGNVSKVEPVGPSEIDVKSGGKHEGSTSNENEGAPNTESSRGDNSGTSFTSKDDRINKKVAFKEAAETVRQLESDSDKGEHQERVSAVANGYYNILKDMGDNQ